jgi:opacity protein-like surface antigen
MRRLLLSLVGAVVLAAPAGAAEGPVQVSLGYSFAKYVETGGGTAPVGAFLALSGRNGLSPELDLGWQRDSEKFLDETITLNTFTAVAGPRFGFASSGAIRPFVHLLAGARHDRIQGESNTAWGGFAGGGVDIKAGDRVSVRLGADFQMFFDEGENLKTLRLGVGLTF